MGRGILVFGARGYWRHLLSLGAAICLLNTFSSARATPIATWTFETSQPSGAGPYSPEVGSGSATGSHAGAAVYSSPAGDGSSHSFSSNTWAVGDYDQFEVSTTGLANILLNWDQTSSSTGPRDYQLEYSVDGTSYTNFGSAYMVLGNGTAPNAAWNASTYVAAYHYTVDLSSVSAIDNATTVYFRLADVDTTSASGGTVGTGGTDRVDNFSVSTVPVPEPNSACLAVLAIAAALGFASRKHLPRAGGSRSA